MISGSPRSQQAARLWASARGPVPWEHLTADEQAWYWAQHARLAPSAPVPPPTGGRTQRPALSPASWPIQRHANPKRRWPAVLLFCSLGFVLLLVIGVGCTRSVSQTASRSGAAEGPLVSAVAPSAAAAVEPTAAPEPPSTPIVHEGKGDDVVTLDKPAGPAVLDFECTRCSSNTVLKTDGPDALLVNEIGSYKGRHLIDIYDTARTSTLEINAKGSWKVTVTPGLSALRRSTGPISGKGDDVVVISGAASKALVTNRGKSNFVVKVVGASGSDLAINEIGSYQGTVVLRAPAAVMVTSSGDWSITPS